jgi:hypothetical protein
MTEAGGSLVSGIKQFPIQMLGSPDANQRKTEITSSSSSSSSSTTTTTKIIIAHVYRGSFYMTNDIGDHRQR